MPGIFDIGKSPGTVMAGNDGTKIVKAETFSSARNIASVSLVSILSAAYTIPAGLLGVGDQIICEGGFTISQSAGTSRTYTLNVGPFMSDNWAGFSAHVTATVRTYLFRVATTIISNTAQASVGLLLQSQAGTVGTTLGENTAAGVPGIVGCTSTVDLTVASTFDVKVLSSLATGTQEASLISATVTHIPKRDWTY